ncbi:hypothetical protein EV215_1295 [Hypnocyclicus thermotrophus]|uniref:Divergent PAP2 family protein n=1 Tax=Hypnocyclicus thermotrophus TaxID=1627895 RepID=A0AA46DYA0_9FUSO|nr:divergent PAP2 family protein [Hypnocyclicus thermotrophus]TDT69760.1 hypothetical protein EV215_1295 [Hypnocyclicus thermotrophus]
MTQGIIFGNKILDVAFLAAFLAQFYKVISPFLKKEGLKFHRLFETGGMPSSHSSTVTSIATSIAILKGSNSIEFAIATVFGIIVMYDATGIRRAAGKQAGVINKIVRNLKNNNFDMKEMENDLKELLGHEPIEVLVGALLGIAVSFAMKSYILK